MSESVSQAMTVEEFDEMRRQAMAGTRRLLQEAKAEHTKNERYWRRLTLQKYARDLDTFHRMQTSSPHAQAQTLANAEVQLIRFYRQCSVQGRHAKVSHAQAQTLANAEAAVLRNHALMGLQTLEVGTQGAATNDRD